jgi:hypothetical protein
MGREQGHGLGHVPPRGGRSHPEPGRDLRERLSFPQVNKDQEGLLARVELAP